ncbi:uncharacterized protein LOC105701069 [Orussus abietinus]|uniref:uncharacterized protein LOC105701069 n=1 Tax=Orussus abietinus TaxID=222816 RepID=UPI000626674E|nr:uncharacterized protein LOC105701069 [Orussus abietinus]
METVTREPLQEWRKPLVKDLNDHIVCPLCRGYLIDATTLAECLHSFCRGCIARRLRSGVRACPVCSTEALSPLMPDASLQRLVYLIVPGLFRSELERRTRFRATNPQCPPPTPLHGGLELTLDDIVSLSLHEIPRRGFGSSGTEDPNEGPGEEDAEEVVEEEDADDNGGGGMERKENRLGETRYLKCPAGVTVRHLVRLLMLKRGWDNRESESSLSNGIEMLCVDTSKCQEGNSADRKRALHPLDPSWTLLDLACIFRWNRESPMKLYYRIAIKDEVCEPAGKASSESGASLAMEHLQRPLTPPPSPKPLPSFGLPCPPDNPLRVRSPPPKADPEEARKPRCEVTPVMRVPGLLRSPLAKGSSRSKIRLPAPLPLPPPPPPPVQRKRRKRRNKRVIAEITTTPREDLLKLKVRLTPRPPRITSSGAGQVGQVAKEKLLEMRAVRREKPKPSPGEWYQPERQEVVEETAEETVEEPVQETVEETIEEITDGIPDEVVRITQGLDPQPEKKEASPGEPGPKTTQASDGQESKSKRKDEELLRRLGLVAVGEANDSVREKTRIEYADRCRLERQLRESKANRVKSLMAEKQMRDALKTIMSRASERESHEVGPSPNQKRKGPPPLAPLHLVKQPIKQPANKYAVANESTSTRTNEAPLDLSSGLKNNDVLDLSSGPAEAEAISTGHRSIPTVSLQRQKSENSNLKTLSDTAVSLLSGCNENLSRPKTGLGTLPGKVSLRIPQPHQRMPGFGIKIKPNLGVRHIPNPQAVVASQYRNQRANAFEAAQRLT